MSRLYGTVQGSRGVASRCGARDLRVSAQSYDGSVIIRMSESTGDKEPTIRIELNDDTSNYGETYFRGTYSELKELLSRAKTK